MLQSCADAMLPQAHLFSMSRPAEQVANGVSRAQILTDVLIQIGKSPACNWLFIVIMPAMQWILGWSKNTAVTDLH